MRPTDSGWPHDDFSRSPISTGTVQYTYLVGTCYWQRKAHSFMIPAIDPNVDYKALVRQAYDACAAAYDASRKTEPGFEMRALLDLLDDGDAVLDIGCGAGVPIATSLAARYRVTGVDISPEMIYRARQNVPFGDFICADIMSATFPPSSFDAVVAFYSVFHLPRQEHPDLFRRIHQWLKPGGYLLCTLSHCSEEGYTEEDFHGVTMYWSNYQPWASTREISDRSGVRSA